MIEKLLAYQNEDAKLIEIENKLSSCEARKIAKNAQKVKAESEEIVNTLDAKAAQLANELESVKDEQRKLIEQKDELEKAIASVVDQNEASYLVKKAEELIGKIKSVAQTVENLSNEMQSVLGDFVAVKNKIKTAQAEIAQNAPIYNELKNSVADERATIEAKLEKLKKDVDAHLMEEYLKNRSAKKFPMVREVDAGVCSGCYMSLSMAEIDKLKAGEVIVCECGRILYSK